MGLTAPTSLSSRILFEHEWMCAREDELDFGGRRRRCFYLESRVTAVAAVALTADGQIVLTRQDRHPAGGVIYDLPAGRLRPGEAPADGARRELEEETGYRAGRLEPLGRHTPFPGSLKVMAYLFLATDLKPGQQHLDADEEVEVVLMPFADALAMVRRGEMIDSSLQLGILLAAQRFASLRHDASVTETPNTLSKPSY